MKLTESQCHPCRSDSQALTPQEAHGYLKQIPAWSIISENSTDHLVRAYSFKSYRECLAFTQQLGDLAEEADHHPTITLEWGKVTVHWWTHTIKGLHLNDFIMAARSDAAFDSSMPSV